MFLSTNNNPIDKAKIAYENPSLRKRFTQLPYLEQITLKNMTFIPANMV